MAMCFVPTVRGFAVVLGLFLLAEILAAAFQKSAITTIERRFDLPSTATALISTSFQMGSLAVSLFVSYYGSRWHRPRVLALGAILIVIGNIIAALPQFVGGRYNYGGVSYNTSISSGNWQAGLCGINSESLSSSCTNEEINKKSSENKLFILIVVGIILCGVGGSGTSPLGIAYVDDFANSRNSPVYVGIIMTIGMIGPAFGFILGALVLKIWVDVGWVDTSKVTITPIHPSWVGAWWLGFIIGAIAILFTGIPFLLFPKTMKVEIVKDEEAKKSLDTVKKSPNIFSNNEDEKSWKNEKITESIFGGFFISIKRIITTIDIAILLFIWIFGANVIVGIITFLPKYIEVQYGTSASAANMVYGTINIPCLVAGTLIGTAIMRKFQLNKVGMSKLILAITCLTASLMVPILFLGCDTIDIAGITVPYSSNSSFSTTSLNPINSCNHNCGCKDGVYTPVCGEDLVTYMSPCHAGCNDFELMNDGNIKKYTSCACIENVNGTYGGYARPGRCEESRCPHLFKYMMMFKSSVSFFGGMITTPIYMYILRSVRKSDKSFTLGISFVVIRVLGWIPAPIYYGKIIDSTCLYWGYRSCSPTAYCKIYDNTLFRYKYIGTIIGWKVLNLLATIVLYKYQKKVQKDNQENEKQKLSELNNSSLDRAQVLVTNKDLLKGSIDNLNVL